MNCEQCQSIIEDYLLEEAPDSLAAECRSHLAECPICREEFEHYSRLIQCVAGAQRPMPTPQERASLSQALSRVRTEPQRAAPVIKGLPTMVLASAVAFVLVATTLALHTLGTIDLLSQVRGSGLRIAVPVWTVVVFVTSFVPIIVTARRRPLNGMTFRR